MQKIWFYNPQTNRFNTHRGSATKLRNTATAYYTFSQSTQPWSDGDFDVFTPTAQIQGVDNETARALCRAYHTDRAEFQELLRSLKPKQLMQPVNPMPSQFPLLLNEADQQALINIKNSYGIQDNADATRLAIHLTATERTTGHLVLRAMQRANADPEMIQRVLVMVFGTAGQTLYEAQQRATGDSPNEE